MLNFSPEKLLLVAILALVVLGPNRLPQAARTLGRLLAELRRVSTSLQSEVQEALAEPRDALSNAVGDLGLHDIHSNVRQAILGPTVPGPAPAASAPTASALAPSAPPPVPDDPSLN